MFAWFLWVYTISVFVTFVVIKKADKICDNVKVWTNMNMVIALFLSLVPVLNIIVTIIGICCILNKLSQDEKSALHTWLNKESIL